MPRFIFSHQYVGARSAEELESMKGVLPEGAAAGAAVDAAAAAAASGASLLEKVEGGVGDAVLPQAQRDAYQRGRMLIELA